MVIEQDRYMDALAHWLDCRERVTELDVKQNQLRGAGDQPDKRDVKDGYGYAGLDAARLTLRAAATARPGSAVNERRFEQAMASFTENLRKARDEVTVAQGKARESYLDACEELAEAGLAYEAGKGGDTPGEEAR